MSWLGMERGRQLHGVYPGAERREGGREISDYMSITAWKETGREGVVWYLGVEGGREIRKELSRGSSWPGGREGAT